MTARLLSRWARLLPRCPRRAARLQGSPVRPVEPPWPRAQVRPAARALCDRSGLARHEESGTAFKRTHLDDLLGRATSPEEVLQLWTENGGSANQAAACLIQLSRLAVEKGGVGRQELLQDPRCADLLDTVGSQVSTVWNGTLVSVLRSLSALGAQADSATLRSLQTEVLWRVRRLSYRQLAFLLEWAVVGRSRGQPLQGGGLPLTNELLKQLDLRWAELSDPRTVGVLMGQAAHLSPALMEKLEDKALELAERFSGEDIRRVALALAAQGRRAVPLLRALSYHLHQRPTKELHTPLLLDIAFAYGKLNFHQTQVFQRIAAELLPRLPDLSPTDVTRCAKSFAFLKWLHLPLFEGFTEHYIAHAQRYGTLQLSNLLMSLAKLNFQPSKGDEFFKKVHLALDNSWRGLELFLQVDLVWSLCVLQQAKPEYIAALAQPAYHAKLSEGSASRAESYCLKLCQISAEGALGGSGLSLPPPVSLATPPAAPPTQLQTQLHTALMSLTDGRAGALHTSVSTVYGWTLDGELVLDSENKPLSLETLTAPHLPGDGGSDHLPEGARRMAFVAWEFPHFCSRSKDLQGRYAMQKRHLQLAGFLLVEVPYYEWLELKSDWQRVAYLKDKIGKAVAEEMAK
ncbi:FAST kinase domain-containing protein 4 isoform X2 [Denticeps clupeoides]|uniref:FAST kinase domain-containing protein 4 isoform X2 n=1 Tax=Denticeps clupeoides TaxID=299321 RepID=UPI0010A2BCFD|nr:FAST kinase domain-containing protein 4 isoform X2 [Denticeps clupeoides]